MKILQWFFEKLVGVEIDRECESECGNFEGSVFCDLRSGNVVSWVRHEGHVYVVNGHATDPDQMRRTWTSYAANKQLSLDWMAAAFICRMIREEVG